MRDLLKKGMPLVRRGGLGPIGMDEFMKFWSSKRLLILVTGIAILASAACLGLYMLFYMSMAGILSRL